MLNKIRHFVNFNTYKSIYQAILESQLNYSLTVCAQNANSIKTIFSLTKEILTNYAFFEKKCTYI